MSRLYLFLLENIKFTSAIKPFLLLYQRRIENVINIVKRDKLCEIFSFSCSKTNKVYCETSDLTFQIHKEFTLKDTFTV